MGKLENAVNAVTQGKKRIEGRRGLKLGSNSIDTKEEIAQKNVFRYTTGGQYEKRLFFKGIEWSDGDTGQISEDTGLGAGEGCCSE